MEKRNDPTRKKTGKAQRVDKQFKDLWTGAVYDDENEAFIRKDGSCFDFVRIKTKDLRNASNDETAYDIARFTKLYRVFSDDLKIIALNYPCNTQPQIDYFTYKEKVTKNDLFDDWLIIKRKELEYLKKETTSREYIFMVFSKNMNDLISSREQIFAVLGTTSGLSERLTKDKKLDIAARMNNKCMTSF